MYTFIFDFLRPYLAMCSGLQWSPSLSLLLVGIISMYATMSSEGLNFRASYCR